MEYYDSHCHLNDPSLLPRIEEEIKECREAGLSVLLCIGYDVASSRLAVELAERYEEVYAAVGVHPENIQGLDMGGALQEIEGLAKHPKVLAIGEIGLDYHWYEKAEDREAQKPWFLAQISLANKLNLPVSVHARDATKDVFDILKANPVAAGVALHCYSGSVESMREFAKLGVYFGFDGPITFKNAVTPKECVKACLPNRLLVETDSPYMAPTPYRGKPNSPKYVPLIVAEMAKLRGVSEEEMNRQLWNNFSNVFRVKQ